jgi:hypothetical protein
VYCIVLVQYNIYTSHPDSSWTPGVFYTYFYNYNFNRARRLRLEKLLHLEPSTVEVLYQRTFKSTSGSRWRFQKWNGRYETVSEVKRLHIYNGYI